MACIKVQGNWFIEIVGTRYDSFGFLDCALQIYADSSADRKRLPLVAAAMYKCRKQAAELIAIQSAVKLSDRHSFVNILPRNSSNSFRVGRARTSGLPSISPTARRA